MPFTATMSSSSTMSMPPPPSLFGECPYSVNDVPNDDWTTEHYLLWMLHKLHEHDEHITGASIRAVYETAAEVMGTPATTNATTNNTQQQPPQQQQPQHAPDNQTNDDNDDDDDEVIIVEPVKPSTAAKAPPAKAKAALPATAKKANKPTAVATVVVAAAPAVAAAAAPVTTGATELHVEVVSCGVEPHRNGTIYKLQPKPRAPCWVGRSKAQKLREKGISLPFDTEVSSTHGKFEARVNPNGSGSSWLYYYTDAGSTNGSYVLDPTADPEGDHHIQTLEAKESFLLHHGTELVVGKTQFKIHIVPQE